MKNLLIFVLLLVPVICFSQIENFHYPKIAEAGKDIHAFIPNGWEMMDSASGNFNHDTINDLALVIQSNNVLNVDSTDPGSGFAPKSLIVLFKKPDQTWKLSCAATEIFDTSQSGVQNAHPYQGIGARNDTLEVTFGTGGTTRDYTSYYFKFQNKDWYLVGEYEEEVDLLESLGVNMVSNETRNFVTGKVVSTIYDQDTKQYKYDTKRIPVKPLIKLAEFDNR